jgi:hypothetical protein
MSNQQPVNRSNKVENFIYARSFRDSLVYKRVFIGSRRIFDLTKGFPEEENVDTEDPLRLDW